MSTVGSAAGTARARVTAVREWLERLLLWRIWERMLEIEFVDRSVALAAKAFISFFPLVIVAAAFVPDDVRTSIVSSLISRFGIEGHALVLVRQAFASAEHVKQATGVLGLVLALFYATSFTTALQRVYLRAWRRPPRAKAGTYWRGGVWLVVVLLALAALGGLRDALGDGIGLGVFVVLSLGVVSCMWWLNAWLFLRGDVRLRVLLPTGIITGIAMTGFAASAPLWMPETVTHNQTQFGFFGIALALVSWFSGAAIFVLVGACAGPVFAEDTGPVGRFIRGGDDAAVLTADAPPSLPPPARELTLRDAFHSTEET